MNSSWSSETMETKIYIFVFYFPTTSICIFGTGNINYFSAAVNLIVVLLPRRQLVAFV